MSNSIYQELLIQHPEYYAGEINKGESETVPNQAITAKEAVERALRNLPVPARSMPQEAPYDGMEEDVDLDQVSNEPHFDSEMDVIDHYSTLSEKVGKASQNVKKTQDKGEKHEELSSDPSPDPAAKPETD